jgi:hypothetical protein
MKLNVIARPAYLLAVAVLLCSATVFAQTQGGPPQGQGNSIDNGSGDHPNGPPPEAIAACNGKASGDTCSFVGRQGEQLTGTCFRPPLRGQQGQQGDASASSTARSQIMKPLACRPPRKGN